MPKGLTKKQKQVFVASLTAVLAALALWSGPAPLRTPQRERRINVLERVTLGDVKQWISIRGHDKANPVLLFLHGGPGSANLAKLRLQCPELEKHFVVVTWDQRGAGKSHAAFDTDTLSVEQIVSDTSKATLPNCVRHPARNSSGLRMRPTTFSSINRRKSLRRCYASSSKWHHVSTICAVWHILLSSTWTPGCMEHAGIVRITKVHTRWRNISTHLHQF